MLIQKIDNIPLFSIIIPTYNRAKILQRAILSVLKQSYQNFEIIIINDGSEEDYSQIYDDILTCYPNYKIYIINNKSNMGVAYSRNIGIATAKGEYISFLDDDDEFGANFLELTYNALSNSLCKACFSWSSVEYKNYYKNSLNPDDNNASFRIFARDYPNIIKCYEELCSIGIGHGFSIRTSCIRKLGGFSENFKTVEDTDLFFRLILANCKPIVVPEINIIIHKHNYASLTHSAMHELRIKECNELLKIYVEFFNDYPTLKENLIAHINNLHYEILSANHISI